MNVNIRFLIQTLRHDESDNMLTVESELDMGVVIAIEIMLVVVYFYANFIKNDTSKKNIAIELSKVNILKCYIQFI